MDINALGTQYMSSSYVPFGSSAGSDSARSAFVNSTESGAFGELLKKAQNSQAPQGGLPSASIVKNPPIDKSDKLYELCMDLETFLIKNLIKSMRGTVQKSGLIETGFAGEMYEDMLYDEYATAFAKNANFGFAEMAYRDLTGLR